MQATYHMYIEMSKPNICDLSSMTLSDVSMQLICDRNVALCENEFTY